MAWNQECYLRALRFAAEAHAEQTVPGTDFPYLVHLVTVTAEVSRALCSEDVDEPDLAILCAMLHDSIEDVDGVDFAVIEGRFGPKVAAGVQALSKDPEIQASEGKAAAMRDSLDRIRSQSREVWMAKLADRITNLQQPPDYWTNEKRQRYRAEAGVILESLGEASPFLASRLAGKIEGYGAWID